VAAQLEHDDAYAPEVDGPGMHQRVDEPVGLLVGRRGGAPRRRGCDPLAHVAGEQAQGRPGVPAWVVAAPRLLPRPRSSALLAASPRVAVAVRDEDAVLADVVHVVLHDEP